MEDQPASAPPPQEARGGSFGFFHFLGAFLLLFILYVLSVGPAAKIYQSSPAPKALDNFYAPLESLYRQSSTCHSFYDWYFQKVWKIRIPTPATPSTPAQATQTTNTTN